MNGENEGVVIITGKEKLAKLEKSPWKNYEQIKKNQTQNKSQIKKEHA